MSRLEAAELLMGLGSVWFVILIFLILIGEENRGLGDLVIPALMMGGGYALDRNFLFRD